MKGFKPRFNVPMLLANIYWMAMLDAQLNVPILLVNMCSARGYTSSSVTQNNTCQIVEKTAKCSNVVGQHLMMLMTTTMTMAMIFVLLLACRFYLETRTPFPFPGHTKKFKKFEPEDTAFR